MGRVLRECIRLILKQGANLKVNLARLLVGTLERGQVPASCPYNNSLEEFTRGDYCVPTFILRD